VIVDRRRYGRWVANDWASATRFEQDIQAVADGRSDTLDLGRGYHYGAPRELPAAVRQLTGLRTLRLSGSGLTELPAWLADLPVETIDARGCPLQAMPPMPWVRWALDAAKIHALGRLIDPGRVYGAAIGPDDDAAAIAHLAGLIGERRLSLTELVIEAPRGIASATWGNLADVDRRVDQLIADSPRLRMLAIVDCPLGRVPEPIRRLRHLSNLRLSAVLPDEVPDWLFELPALTGLDLSHNRLSRLPATLGKAKRLTELDLSYNPIREVPEQIWQLDRMVSLDLWGCPIQRIPADILRLHALSDLRVDETRPELTVPPPEVTARGLDAIKSYWSQERASGMDYLSEAKLLIVGEAGAGKTTLAKKILHPTYPLNAGEGSTQGIAVLSWRFASAVRVTEAAGERMLERDFRVNIWDFGGQEIYHSTHQFFLTKRSVYVLVSDERKEDTDFRYWLDVVNLLSDGSPLIIVQNRKQGRIHELDVRTLRQEYPNLVGTLSVDLSDNSGLAETITRVRRELELLPHIGTALPKTWQDVRMALDADTREYISSIEFFRICAEHGFVREADMRQLGGFLHDLGICLYFQEDPVLSRTVVLKPEWGTGAVYRVLDDPRIVANQGVFGPDDLRRIWHEPIYEPVRDELLRLMAKFSLCFPVPATEQYVAPQLLSSIRPAYPWDEPGDLTLRYEYDVMPKGIVRRLIVELHDLIEEDAVWRSGVVFEYESGRAEVIEDYRRRRLQIRLAARNPRVMLSVVDRALNMIHRSYPDLKFERLRPCSCDVCVTAEEPTMFGVRELEDFARVGDQIQCRASHQLVDAAALLSELWQPDDASVSRRAAGPGEVFVSYKWGGDADALADEMQGKLAARGLVVTRDRDELRYRDPIQQFMRRLGAGKAVIVLLDDAYLRSKNSMFELTEVADREDFVHSVFPIIMPNANIFDPIGRLDYVRYWEERLAELDQAMRAVGQENLQGIREELDLYERIRNAIARITDVLADMNTLTAAKHVGSDFAELYQALDQKLGSA
jgi:internalin A